MARLIGETPPGPQPPLPLKAHKISSSAYWRFLVLGKVKDPRESPGVSIKVPNLSVYSSII